MGRASPSPAQIKELWGSGWDAADRPSDTQWLLGLDMGLGRAQPGLLMPPVLLLICLRLGAGLGE